VASFGAGGGRGPNARSERAVPLEMHEANPVASGPPAQTQDGRVGWPLELASLPRGTCATAAPRRARRSSATSSAVSCGATRVRTHDGPDTQFYVSMSLTVGCLYNHLRGRSHEEGVPSREGRSGC